MSATTEDTECPTCGRDDFDSFQGVSQHHSIQHGDPLRETVVCEWCGDEKQVKRHAAKGARFCSRKCKDAWTSANKTGKNNHNWKEQPQKVCATKYCTQEFSLHPSTMDEEHCSDDCRDWGPWRNQELLEYLQNTREMSQTEIATHLDCYQTTVSRWLRRHGIETRPNKTPSADPRLTDETWLRTAYHDKGMSLAEIAQWTGAGRSVVHNWCDRHDITVTYRGSPDKLRDESWLVAQYTEERRSTLDIATELGCNPQTVANWLQRYGVTLRDPHTPGEGHPLHDPDSPYEYGPNWSEQRAKARERDGYTCQACGAVEPDDPDNEFPVHHITPRRAFVRENGELDYERANRLDNLCVLCESCHPKWEGVPLRPDTDVTAD